MAFSKLCVTRELIKNKTVFILSNIYFIFTLVSLTLLTLPIGGILVLLNKFFPTKITAKNIRQFGYYYGRTLCYINTPILPVRIINKDEANKHKPCIIIANHQSFLDLYLCGMQTCNNFAYMVKSWPYKLLFFFAPMMHAAEYINVEKLSAEEIEKGCLKLLHSGTSLVIFPEGKRTRTGELGRFHTGAFRLACLANVPIAPLVFENTYVVFPAGAKFLHSQQVRITMLNAIFPEDFATSDLAHRDMMRFAHQQYVDYFYNLKHGASHA